MKLKIIDKTEKSHFANLAFEITPEVNVILRKKGAKKMLVSREIIRIEHMCLT